MSTITEEKLSSKEIIAGAEYNELLDSINSEISELEAELQLPETTKSQNKYRKISKKYSKSKEIQGCLEELVKYAAEFKATEAMLHAESDQEMKSLAEQDLENINNKLNAALEKYQELTIPVDPLDDGNAIIEIRAGAGGEESSIFTQEMFRAYSKYAEKQGFKVEIANISYSSAGAFKEVVFFVEGDGVYGRLKYENGVHRVQRIPETESSGRVHTSAVSVVVLPESDEIEVEINESDLRIDVYRSSGPGGQSVNTTDSAVRIVHDPTGIVVTCQDEKSQLKNKSKAMKILQAKLYEIEKEKQEKEIGELRQSAIKTGDRSAKIRTYNFPQSRITDHRIKQSWHNLSDVMEGEFADIITALKSTATK